MSLVESLQVWKEGVQYYSAGDFPNALKKFIEMNDSSAKITFNIGRVYMSLCELQKSLQAFQHVIKKDGHLAIGHFMLGVVNLMCSRHADALINFNETYRNLRESKFIDYKQLGMRYKLFKCEVLLNRAVCLSSLGYLDSAIEDLFAALQCKMEPRHSVIDISLNNLQRGHSIEFLVMDAVFQPPKSKTANLEKRDYLGKAQVVVDTDAYEMMKSPGKLRDHVKQSRHSSPNVAGELYQVLYNFTAQSSTEISVKANDVITVIEKGDDGWFTMVTNINDLTKTGLVPGSYLTKFIGKEMNNNQTLTHRQSLLSDLRKKESRASLRRLQPPLKKHPSALPLDGKPDKIIRRRSDQSPTGADQIYQNEPPVKTFSYGENTSPLLPPRTFSDGRKTALSPKLSRCLSENLLTKSSPNGSPRLGIKIPDIPKAKRESSDSDDDGYEEVNELAASPYAIHDVIPAADREFTNGKSRRKGPERPIPPPKSAATLKFPEPPRFPAPSIPRANTVTLQGSAYDQKQMVAADNAIPKPIRTPPRPIRSKTTSTVGKETRAQTVTVEFVVSTSLRITPSTTQKDIQTSVKDAITKNLSSSLWCDKDGKRIRLDDQRAPNILDLVKDGKLKVWPSS